MRRFSKSVLGVTLLEIMLVLAIAAMVIVMSVRYYQSATASQQTNATLQLIQAITAAADSLSQSTGTYSNVTAANVGALLPGGVTTGLNTPWGTTITLNPSTSNYVVSIPSAPSQVCPLLVSRLSANKNFNITAPSGGATGCAAAAATTITYTYTANP
jgi:type II secretory pathway pseudopilin PulG